MHSRRCCWLLLVLAQATKIGLSVNKVRKSLSAETNQAALRLIASWKDIARQGMAAAAATAPAAAAAAATTAQATVQPVTAPAPVPVASSPASAPAPAPAAAAAASPSTADTKKRKEAPSAGASSADAVKRAKSAPFLAAAAAAAASPAAARSTTPSASVGAARPAASSIRSQSPQPALISLASLTAASGPPPPPPGPIRFNPNLAFYRSSAVKAAAAAQSGGKEVDHTSRKRTGHDSGMDAFLLPTTPSSVEAVALCSLEQMCVDHIAAHLDRYSFLDALPVSLMLRALAKASAEQLGRFEKANPRLLGETESLWRVLCKRSHPTVRESEKPASSTWKAWHAALAKRKDDKLSALGARLKAMQKDAVAEKQSNAVKPINMHSAARIESKGRITLPAGAAAAARGGSAHLSKLKQETKALSVTGSASHCRRFTSLSCAS